MEPQEFTNQSIFNISPLQLPNYISENDWIYDFQEREVKVYWHVHPLINKDYTTDGWRCDGYRNFQQCMSGITDYNQTSNIQKWSCDFCDFDLCKKCIQFSNTIHEKMRKENEKKTFIQEISFAYEQFYRNLKKDSVKDRHEIVQYLEDTHYDLTAIGITNAGKSSLLNELCGHYTLNTSERRETSTIWKIIYQRPNPQLIEKAYQLKVTYQREDGTRFQEKKELDSRDELKNEIRQLSSENLRGEEESQSANTIDHVDVIMPDTDNQIIQSEKFTVIDMPGVEDAIWQKAIESHIAKYKFNTMPVFVINLTQGGLELVQFNNLKREFRDIENVKITFVFTKFNSVLNDIEAKLMEEEPDDYDQEVLNRLQETFDKFKNDIEKVFNNSVFFVYDSNASGYYVNSNLQVCREQDEFEEYYAIETSIDKIREYIKDYYKTNVNWNLIKIKVKNLHDECYIHMFDILQKAKQKDNFDEIMQTRMEVLQQTSANCQSLFEKRVQDLFLELPLYIEQIIIQLLDNPITKFSNALQFKLKVQYDLQKLIIVLEKQLGTPIKEQVIIFLQATMYLYKKIPQKIAKQVRTVVGQLDKSCFTPNTCVPEKVATLITSHVSMQSLKVQVMQKMNRLQDLEASQAIERQLEFLTQEFDQDDDQKILEYADNLYNVKARGAYDCLQYLKDNMFQDKNLLERLMEGFNGQDRDTFLSCSDVIRDNSQ